MRVEYFVGEEDVLAWLRFATRRRPQFNKARNQVPALLTAMVPILGWLAFRSWMGIVGGLIAGALLGWMVYPRLMNQAVDRQLRASLEDPPDGLIGDQIMELTEAGLRKQSSAGESVFRYSAIRSIETAGAHAFIMLGPEYAICAPFTADGQMRQFIEELGRRIEPR